ncbi:exopolysaccharide transport family protein [Xanthobacter pseudotagetidis]|uniref:exopolysaccharide transport family protein n=1 Tax=Xanthobacter pseudotagetidis TaxID=3119911 RepID=UPI00372C1F44
MSLTLDGGAETTGTVRDQDVNAGGLMPENRPPAFTTRDFLIATFFHIRIVLIAAMVPLLLALAAAFTAKTEYTAKSLLMVIVSREVTNAGNVTDSGPAVLSIEGLKQVESEVQILESADVIRSTIEQIGIDRLFPSGLLSYVASFLKSDADRMDQAIEKFRKVLRTSVVSGSNVIEVSVTLPNRALAVEATDALVRNYLTYRRKVFENPTARILQIEVERFKADLAATDRDIEALKNKVGIIEFSQDAILAANQVDTLLQRRRQVAERQVAVTAQLAEAEKQMKGLPEQVFDFTQKTDALGNDEDANVLTRLLVERDRIKAQYAPGSQLLRDIDRQIATVRNKMENRSERPYSTDRDVRNPAISYVQNMILSLRVEQDALGRQLVELEQQQKVAEQRLATLRGAETQLTELNRRRDTLSDGYREYLRRAVAANIEETAAKTRESNVRVVQEAGASVTSRNLAIPFLAAGLFGGLLFGAAAGAIASALRTTFIMPSEAERALQLPVLAEFGAMDAGSRALDTALGGLATLLLDTRVDDKPLQLIHFLAPQRGEETPAFCRRLAEEFATQRGLRTLIVDLCAPVPSPLIGSGFEMKGGLAVTRTPLPQLWTAVDVEKSPLLNVRLPLVDGIRMRDELKQAFECVIVCSPVQGTFVVTDRLNQLADGNILMIGAESTRKPSAVHMRDSVLENGGTLLGFVFFGRRYYLPEWIYRRT